MIALKNINPLYLFFSVIQPAISEYERMKLKYEIEFNCRTQAEMLATKVSENQIICKFMINDDDWVNAIRLSRNGELAWKLQSYCREIIINFFFEVPFFNFLNTQFEMRPVLAKISNHFAPLEFGSLQVNLVSWNLVFFTDHHSEQGAEATVQDAAGSPGTEPTGHHQDEPWPWSRWERGLDGGVSPGAVSENTEYVFFVPYMSLWKDMSYKFMLIHVH